MLSCFEMSNMSNIETWSTNNWHSFWLRYFLNSSSNLCRGQQVRNVTWIWRLRCCSVRRKQHFKTWNPNGQHKWLACLHPEYDIGPDFQSFENSGLQDYPWKTGDKNLLYLWAHAAAPHQKNIRNGERELYSPQHE